MRITTGRGPFPLEVFAAVEPLVFVLVKWLLQLVLLGNVLARDRRRQGRKRQSRENFRQSKALMSSITRTKSNVLLLLFRWIARATLGVRVPEDIQMKGFRVKIGPNLDMEVPDVVQSAGGYRGSTAPQRL